MEIKITKRKVLSEYKGGAYSDAYKTYLVYGKLYNDTHTRLRRFRFVFKLWKEDLFAFDDYPERMSIKRQNEVRDELMQFVFDLIKGYDDCKAFYDYCKESIDEYNEWYNRTVV